MNRASGVLLNMSSLPSKFGIGGFGNEVQIFCDFLNRGGFKYWQILPLTTIGLGNSPYSSASAFAINFLYIDPQVMLDERLISEQDVLNCEVKGQDFAVDYDKVYKAKKHLINTAYENNYHNLKQCLDDFVCKNKWVSDYAIFMSLKEINDGVQWWEWSKEYSNYKNLEIGKFIKTYHNKYYYFVFEQYICDIQWRKAKKLCNLNGIKIIGDIPMYVCLDSVEVWSCPDNFLLDENFCPIKVAGVPPDYFSEDGQLWGNPLYNYAYMKMHNYDWWMRRFDRMFELYDILRIDHFRAFSEYYAIDFGEKTAKNGVWVDGVGMELLSKIFSKYDVNKFIAEDLGTIDDKLEKLLKACDIRGMRVMQFGFEDLDSIHLPHNFETTSVGYTATHDNNTTLGWIYSLTENILDYVLQYIEAEKSMIKNGGYNCAVTKIFIKRLIASCCNLAIIPFQDLCGYGADCRMNTPGTPEGNWTFRATQQAINECDAQYFHYLNCLYGRYKK